MEKLFLFKILIGLIALLYITCISCKNGTEDYTPKIEHIEEGPRTGAKNSMGYITTVRSYPFEVIPSVGISKAFDNLRIQKKRLLGISIGKPWGQQI